jgi:DNA invertase Pin-like site-specific DNA recombinase
MMYLLFVDTTPAPSSQVRAACYCRISSDPRDKREGVQRQREDTTALCEVKRWSPTGFYVDNDRSASNGKTRPEWDRLLADVQAGKIDAIAAWDQDRGWRMMYELEALRKFFTKLGRQIPLATTGQGDIDLYSPTGVLTAQIKTAVSEHEIAMMKVRMRRAARHKAEQGRPKWQKAFGYLPGEDGPVLDPTTAPLVKNAYAAVIAGSSLSDIARSFNKAGAYGLNGKPWTRSSVGLFLRKARNAGLREYKGEILKGVKATWEPLVDESTWHAAQMVMTAPGRSWGVKSVRQHLLTSLLRCGKCDSTLTGKWSNATPPKLIYNCRSCRGVAIPAEQVEPFLYDTVGARLARPDAEDLLRDKTLDPGEAEEIRTELGNLYTELRNIGIERGKRLLTGEQAKVATDLINEDIAKLTYRQHDAERARVLDGIPVGKPEAIGAVRDLSGDRYRAVLDLLAVVTILPIGKGRGRVFRPERVDVQWR